MTKLNALLNTKGWLSIEFEFSYFMGFEQRNDQANGCVLPGGNLFLE